MRRHLEGGRQKGGAEYRQNRQILILPQRSIKPRQHDLAVNLKVPKHQHYQMIKMYSWGLNKDLRNYRPETDKKHKWVDPLS